MTFCISTFEKDDECLNILSTKCHLYPGSHFYLLVKTGDSGENPPPFATKNVAHYIIYREHISCQLKTFLLYQLHCNL